MPFTFKLSKRLALMKASLVPAAAAVLTTCQLQDRRGITGPTLPSSSVVQVVTPPDTVTLEPSVTQQFRAYGRTEAGDSVAITMTWSATDGAISSGGLYTAAPSQGDYAVTATVLQASATASSGTPQGVARGYSIVHVRSNPQWAQVVVVPRSVSLGTGGTQPFVAYGPPSNGDSVAVNLTSSAQGGTISSSGLYAAGPVSPRRPGARSGHAGVPGREGARRADRRVDEFERGGRHGLREGAGDGARGGGGDDHGDERGPGRHGGGDGVQCPGGVGHGE